MASTGPTSVARPPDTIARDASAMASAFAVAVSGFPAEMLEISDTRLLACTGVLLGTAASDAARLTVTGLASSNRARSATQLSIRLPPDEVFRPQSAVRGPDRRPAGDDPGRLGYQSQVRQCAP